MFRCIKLHYEIKLMMLTYQLRWKIINSTLKDNFLLTNLTRTQQQKGRSLM